LSKRNIMRRQWVLLFLVLLFCTSTVAVGDPKPISMVVEPARDAQSQKTIQRVYGTDLSEIIYSAVTLLEYRKFVKEISENGSRFITTSGETRLENNHNAREYIKQKLVELSKGRIEVEEIGSYKNVVGKLPGYLPGNNPALAISAHYDSPEGSPGANCDGSGIAAVLELSRVMSQYRWPLDIYFIAFNGLFGFRFMQGSPEVAIEFRNRNLEFLIFYNVDTILVQNPESPSDERILMGYGTLGQSDYHRGQYWAELARTMSTNIGDDLIVPVPSGIFPFWTASDHYALFNRDFNAICAFESGFAVDSSFHRGNDTWSNPLIDYNLGVETTAVIGASMAHIMGRTYGEQTELKYDFIMGVRRQEVFYIPVTTPTTLNLTVRWFGGSSSFLLLDPSEGLVALQTYNHSSAWNQTNVFSPFVSTKGLYTLIVQKDHYDPVGYEMQITYQTDIDGNSVKDSQEYWIDQALFASDQDSDGLSDAEEILYGTDMLNSDSDGDTMPDKFEIDVGLDPNNPADGNQDADGDNLSNAQEYSRGLNLFSIDSDSDLMDDLWEVENGLDPLVDDSMLDLDGDGITNLQEYLNGTNPQIPEAMETTVIWIATPVLVIAGISAFVYVLKRRETWN